VLYLWSSRRGLRLWYGEVGWWGNVGGGIVVLKEGEAGYFKRMAIVGASFPMAAPGDRRRWRTGGICFNCGQNQENANPRKEPPVALRSLIKTTGQQTGLWPGNVMTPPKVRLGRTASDPTQHQVLPTHPEMTRGAAHEIAGGEGPNAQGELETRQGGLNGYKCFYRRARTRKVTLAALGSLHKEAIQHPALISASLLELDETTTR